MRAVRFAPLGIAAVVSWLGVVEAQETPRPPVPDMQQIAAALGVTCEYCHAQAGSGAPGAALTASGMPRFDVAREMIAMTAEINARVQSTAGKTARVECVTCHRGVAIPRQLRDIVLQAAVQKGPDAAVTLYRDLRAQYYGRQAYDFGEQTLVEAADRLAQGRPDAAIALANLNIEFHPQSVRSFLVRGIAQSRRADTTEDAVASFRKVLELDPGNAVAQGWLVQTEQLLKRR